MAALNIKVNADTKQAEESFRRVNMAAKTMERNFSRFGKEAKRSTKPVADGIDKVEKASKKAQKSAKGFIGQFVTGQAIFALAQKGLSLIANQMSTVIELGSDLQETTAKFGTVFESAMGQASASVDLLTESYGQSELAAKKMLSTTGDLLTGLSFTDEAAIDLSTQVSTLAVDLASFSNIEGGAERATEALTKGLLGEREMMKALGIVIGENDVKQELLARGQEKLTGVALRQAKAQITLELAIRQSQKAIGDYERTSDSFANQQRRLNADFEDIQATLGQLLLPLLQEGQRSMLGFTNTIKNALENSRPLQEIIARIAATFNVVKAVLGDVGKAVLSQWAIPMQGVIDSLREMFTGGENLRKVFLVLSGATEILATGFAVVGRINKIAAQGFVDFINIAIQAAETFSTAFEVLTGKKKFKDVKKEFDDVGKSIGKFTDNVKNNISDAITETIDDIANFTKNVEEGADRYQKLSIESYKRVKLKFKEDEEEKTEIVQKETAAQLSILEEWAKENVEILAKIDDAAVKTIDNMSRGLDGLAQNVGMVASTFADSFSTAFETVIDSSKSMADQVTAISNSVGQTISSIVVTIAEATRSQSEMELEALEAAYEKEVEGYQIKEASKVEIAQAELEKLLEVEEKQQDAQAIADAQAKVDEAQREEAMEKKKTDAKTRFEKKRSDLAKKAFEQNKAMQIAMVWIQAATGVVGAWAQSIAQLGPIAGSAAAGVLTALILGTAGAQTGIIASQQFPGFEGGVTGFEGGTAIVGERGPELVTLGRGANVVTNENTNRIVDAINNNEAGAQTGGTTININGDIQIMSDNVEQMQAELIELARLEGAR
jgi:hypothetical protein